MVYQVSIPNFLSFSHDLTRRLSDTLRPLSQWVFVQDGETDKLVSERVGPPKFTAIVKLLAESGVQFEVKYLGDEYVQVATTAPESYDYPYTIPVLDQGLQVGSLSPEFAGKPYRLVMVQKERQDFQLGRYLSGLHGYRFIDTAK